MKTRSAQNQLGLKFVPPRSSDQTKYYGGIEIKIRRLIFVLSLQLKITACHFQKQEQL